MAEKMNIPTDLHGCVNHCKQKKAATYTKGQIQETASDYEGIYTVCV